MATTAWISKFQLLSVAILAQTLVAAFAAWFDMADRSWGGWHGPSDSRRLARPRATAGLTAGTATSSATAWPQPNALGRLGQPRAVGPCTFHVVYWDSAPHCSWPELCTCCGNVTCNWCWHLDSVHACIRHLAKEGTTFREEVEDFVYVSPQRAIRWDLHQFKNHNAKRRKKVLTEENVLAPALRVEMGGATASETGVNVDVFSDGMGHSAVDRFLRSYGRCIREKAQQSSGVAALVTPHDLGVQLNGFGVPHAFFAHEPERGISQVVVLVAGPGGFNGEACLVRLEEALLGRGSEIEGDCSVGPLRLFVPPGTARANAALGQLLLCHDGRRLLPVLEDLRAMGAESYTAWCELMSAALLAVGQAASEDQCQLEQQEAALQRLEQAIATEEQLEQQGDALLEQQEAALQRIDQAIATEKKLEQQEDALQSLELEHLDVFHGWW